MTDDIAQPIAADVERLTTEVDKLREQLYQQRAQIRTLWMSWRQAQLMHVDGIEREFGLQRTSELRKEAKGRKQP